jgi:galactoside O-acetyltransferase
MKSFYSNEELKNIGFKTIGGNVKLSRKVSIYNANNISIGSNVRIDDFCLLSGNITIKNNIHISAFSALYGGGEIIMEDYSGISPRCTLLSATDDFSGNFMIGPQNDIELTNVFKGTIKLNKFSQLGANTTVLGDVEIGEGAITGVMTFVKEDLSEWGIYAGIPSKFIKNRSKKLLKLINE